MTFNIVKADVLDLAPKLPGGNIDLIITDIAYESMELHRKRGTTTRLKESKSSSNKWFPTFPDYKIPKFFDEMFRLMAKNSVMFFFCDEVTMDVVKYQQGIGHPGTRKGNGSRRCASGLSYWKSIPWIKTTLNGEKVRGGTGYHFAAAVEYIMFFEKGKVRLKGAGPDAIFMDGLPDFIPSPRVNGYPTEKPVSVIDYLMRPVTDSPTMDGKKMFVADFMCGSSPVGECALKHGHKYLGADISQDAVDLSNKRLSVIKEDLIQTPQQQEISLGV